RGTLAPALDRGLRIGQKSVRFARLTEFVGRFSLEFAGMSEKWLKKRISVHTISLMWIGFQTILTNELTAVGKLPTTLVALIVSTTGVAAAWMAATGAFLAPCKGL
ncbi:hypothetical protein, partial [Pseudomonas viridiflava]|uniref:hypothetical protein n=1 Tax=Pseudomonas viridiflava TaxID=33069 RepID=UPI0019D0D410